MARSSVPGVSPWVAVAGVFEIRVVVRLVVTAVDGWDDVGGGVTLTAGGGVGVCCAVGEVDASGVGADHPVVDRGRVVDA